jgi:hypothetical protein
VIAIAGPIHIENADGRSSGVKEHESPGKTPEDPDRVGLELSFKYESCKSI